MKTRYIVLALVLGLIMTGCSDEVYSTFDNLEVSSSYITYDATGGSKSITVTAKGNWSLSDVPEWISASTTSGSAGTSTVSFTANDTSEAQSDVAYITCGVNSIRLQFELTLEETETPLSTIAEVMAGYDGTTYKVTGVVTKIANTTYGNFYMSDDSTDEELYVYGTVDSSGSYNWSSFGIEVGDEVTVKGPRSTYGSVIELVDAEFISVSKSLISVESISEETLSKEGGETTVTLSVSGDGLSVEIPEDASEWLFISGLSTGSTSTVTLKALANEGGDRETTVTFYTYSGSTSYSAQATISQEGSIIEASIAEFNAAATGSTQYRVTGYISEVYNAEKGRFYITDYTGETTYVYNMSGFADLGLEEYDIVTLVGLRDEYNGTIEMTSAYLEDSIDVTAATVAELLEAEDSKSVYYVVTGTIGTVKNTTYGNFYLVDGDSEIYVYGMSAGVGTSSTNWDELGIDEGDSITMIGYKTSYNGTLEICGGMFLFKN